MCSVFFKRGIFDFPFVCNLNEQSANCVFNCKWLTGAKLSWVIMKGFKGDKHKTMCCVCNEVINIESMGESALKSQHEMGETQTETLELDIDSLVK